MSRQELSALLAELQAELAENPPLDEALKQSLLALDGNIQRVLAQAVPSAEPGDTPDTEPLATTPPDAPDVQALMQTLETHLEAEHPYLVGTLRELVDRLGKMGI